MIAPTHIGPYKGTGVSSAPHKRVEEMTELAMLLLKENEWL